MKSIIFFLLFAGMVLVIHGIYQQKYNELEKNLRVEYRFIPRTYYDEQLTDSTVSAQFKNMFSKESPWYDRNVSIGGPPELKSEKEINKIS
jgi:hypothetical protein